MPQQLFFTKQQSVTASPKSIAECSVYKTDTSTTDVVSARTEQVAIWSFLIGFGQRKTGEPTKGATGVPMEAHGGLGRPMEPT